MNMHSTSSRIALTFLLCTAIAASTHAQAPAPTPPQAPVPPVVPVSPRAPAAPAVPLIAAVPLRAPVPPQPPASPQEVVPAVPATPDPPAPSAPKAPEAPSAPVAPQAPTAPQAPVAAQTTAQAFPSLESIQSQAELDKVVMALSLALFDAYNRCDLEAFRSFLDEDIEFYHDQGGVTLGAAALTESIKKNICGGDVRRELVVGTFQANYMKGYGAVELGTHRFVHPKSNNPAGEGKYISLWQYKDGKWKITREISYGHHLAKVDATK